MPFPDPPHSNEPSDHNMKIYREVRDTIRNRLHEFFEAELKK
jgi:hypothetical protein